MTIGDPFSRDAAVSGRTVALPLINQPVPYEAGDPRWSVSVAIGWCPVLARLVRRAWLRPRVLVVGAGRLGSPVLLT